MWKSFAGVYPADSPEAALLRRLVPAKIPRHVAVIMDGNGRWAEKRKLNRIDGHREGGERAEEIIECSTRLGVGHLTLFTFSTENWRRPIREVRFLFRMLYEKLEEKLEMMMRNGIRFHIIGDMDALPARLRDRLADIMAKTSRNRRLQLNLAFNYGGRADILQALRRMREAALPVRSLNERALAGFLQTRGIPDPDLIIRTSGEVRISNFFLFQAAYSELYFTPVLWPDFRPRHLFEALIDFQARKRRYGAV